MDQKPSVGRIVHYQWKDVRNKEAKPICYPAIITDVPTVQVVGDTDYEDKLSGEVTIHIFGLYTGQGEEVFRSVKFSKDPKPGCWSWPPKV